jgi:hypothetical protein
MATQSAKGTAKIDRVGTESSNFEIRTANQHSTNILSILGFIHRFFGKVGPDERTTRAGTPMAKLLGGISFVTTEAAPTTAWSPIETPFRITALQPIQQSLPILIGEMTYP